MDPDAVDSMDFALPSETPEISQLNQSFQQTLQLKDACCLYPIYFDPRYSRTSGRRVSLGRDFHAKMDAAPKGKIVLPIHIQMACHRMGLVAEIEWTKRHPVHYFGWGRVRCVFKNTKLKDGRVLSNS